MPGREEEGKKRRVDFIKLTAWMSAVVCLSVCPLVDWSTAFVFQCKPFCTHFWVFSVLGFFCFFCFWVFSVLGFFLFLGFFCFWEFQKNVLFEKSVCAELAFVVGLISF